MKKLKKCGDGESFDDIDWAPIGVDEYAKSVAIESANNAIRAPFVVIQSTVTK